MRGTLAVLITFGVAFPLRADEPPLVEKYLHSGKYVQGEQDLMVALSLDPDDDQVRFGLGVLQFIHGIENLGQSLHKYGVKSEHTDVPFLRLPVPENPDAEEIDYAAFRKILDEFVRDLSRAEVTLAGIKDDNVKLPLRLAEIRVDLDNDGQADDTLVMIMDKIMRQEFEFLKDNPEFQVTFDRGDVPWLRSYCHVLMSMLDAYLALDLEYAFVRYADELFTNPAEPPDWYDVKDDPDSLDVLEPERLGRFRKHLIQVAVLNRETWKHIRAEKDDDFEWLPHPGQTGIFGMPVRDNMIDGWLAMMDELQALFDGQRTIPPVFSGRSKGLNLKLFLDDPPAKFESGMLEHLPHKYYTDDKEVDIGVLFRAASLFDGPTTGFYVAWFN